MDRYEIEKEVSETLLELGKADLLEHLQNPENKELTRDMLSRITDATVTTVGKAFELYGRVAGEDMHVDIEDLQKDAEAARDELIVDSELVTEMLETVLGDTAKKFYMTGMAQLDDMMEDSKHKEIDSGFLNAIMNFTYALGKRAAKKTDKKSPISKAIYALVDQVVDAGGIDAIADVATLDNFRAELKEICPTREDYESAIGRTDHELGGLGKRIIESETFAPLVELTQMTVDYMESQVYE